MILNNDERINEINENLKLIEKKDGLVFGTDAYLLSAILPSRSRHIGAELGAGTGVVSLLALSKKKCAKIHAVEVQGEFAELCQRNAALNSLDASFNVINKKVLYVIIGICLIGPYLGILGILGLICLFELNFYDFCNFSV